MTGDVIDNITRYDDMTHVMHRTMLHTRYDTGEIKYFVTRHDVMTHVK